ncbi:phosphate regulon protein [Bdellovibrio bacteriovorus]|uniref:Phosphate regulon protein n=2 Tax=Bdellovibrio bacteriovorus TaxID=959 RepID=A0A150WSD5_BDEBC|nr:phosphate regulon protein [Bdellovibrio bacteriovorus]
MQLALSDFAVEVKSVPVGLDVLAVTKTFNPDIIFADVLLTKRSGYEVCADIKMDPATAQIPVVLMWSGFMEIDEEKATTCKADRRLEKPFDAEHLRSIVNDLVVKTKANPVSSFLSFPEMPEFEETPAEANAPAEDRLSNSDVFAIPEVEDADAFSVPGEEFSAVPLTNPRSQDEAEEGGWAHQDLTKFKIQIPEAENDFASKFVIPQDDDLNNAHIEMDGEFEEISFDKKTTPKLPAAKPAPHAAKGGTSTPNVDSFVSKVEKSVKEQMMETLQRGSAAAKAPAGPATSAPNAQGKAQSKGDLDPQMMEKIIREEAREVIESICWKVLPEIAERIVRAELNKLLKETEKNI